MGTDPIDDHIDVAQGVTLGKLGPRHADLGEAEQLATAQATEMWMWRVGRIVGHPEAPDPIVGGDAMRQSLLQQPIQVAIQGYPIDELPGILPQSLLQFLVAQRFTGIEKCL